MAGIPSWALGLAVAWALVYALRLAAGVKALWELELWPARFELEDEAAVPPAWRSFLAARIDELRALGLVPVAWVRFTAQGDAPDGPPKHGLCFTDPSGETSVLLSESELHDGREPHALSLLAAYADGTWLHGLNGVDWAVLGVPAGVELLDPHAPSMAELLAVLRGRHLARREVSAARILDPATAVAEWNRLAAAVHAHLEDAGLARPLGAPAAGGGLAPLRLRFGAAVRATARARAGLRRLQALFDARVARDGGAARPRAELPPALEVESFLRFEASQRRRLGRGRWLATFALTGVAFVASLLHWVEPEHTLVVAGAVLLHELGHYAAMRAFGYRDARIFFVPFFGAAAAGTKQEVSLAEELLVLFAGPVPGIALAGGLLCALPTLRGDPSFQFLLVVLLGLNGFNLLPIYPLDGGKIVDALLFARRPALVFLFRGSAAGLLLAGAWYADDPVLALLGVVVAAGLSAARRAATVERAVWAQRRAPERPTEDVLLLAAIAARRLGFGAGPPAARFALLRHVRERVAREQPGVVPTVGWLAAHGVALAASLLALLELGVGRGPEPAEPGGAVGRRVECPRAVEELDLAVAHLVPAHTSTESVLVSFRCEEPRAEAATALGDELAPLELTSNLAPVRPPWVAAHGRAEEARVQARTRHTYARLRRAEHELSAERQRGPARWWDGGRALFGGERELRALAEEREARLHTWVAAQAGDPSFDVALARELLAHPGSLHGAPERLGLLPAEPGAALGPAAAPEAFLFFGLSAEAGALTTHARARDRRAHLGLARHLCARGCGALRYELRRSALDEGAGGGATGD